MLEFRISSKYDKNNEEPEICNKRSVNMIEVKLETWNLHYFV